MNNYQDEYPESDTQPRVKLREPIQRIGGGGGWWILLKMFDNPFAPYLPAYVGGTRTHAQAWWINVLVWFLDAGVITLCPNQDGYQLTADGRYYVTQYLAYLDRYERGVCDERDLGLFDSITDEGVEYMLRVQETY